MSSKPSIEDIYPLTALQEGIYYHASADRDSAVYWNQLSASITGVIDQSLFKKAWQSVVECYPILRTGFTFNSQGQALQVVAKMVELPWYYEDCSDLTMCEQDGILKTYMVRDLATPPDLSRAPLTRVALFKRSATSYTLIWSLHHLILDGWSGPLVLQSMFGNYARLMRGEQPEVYAKGSFSDYVRWLGDRDNTREEVFWREYFQSFQHTVTIADNISTGTASKFVEVDHTFTKFQSDSLLGFARASHVTLNTLVQCAWGLVLAAECGNTKITLGVTIADRPAEIAEVDEIVGLLIATLPLNLDTSTPQTVHDWLRHTQDQFSELCEFKSPLKDIHEWSGRPRNKPLFDNMMVFENFPYTKNLAQSAGLLIDTFEARESTNYATALAVVPAGELQLKLTSQESLVSRDKAKRLMQRLDHILGLLCIEGDTPVCKLSLLTATERAHLINWNSNGRSLPYSSVIAGFTETVERTPDAVAVCFEQVSLNYLQLDQASTAFAARLVEAGVEQNQLVAIGLPRSEMLPVVILGVLKAGAGYLPLDVSFPEARLSAILCDSQCEYLVTTKLTECFREFAGIRLNVKDLKALDKDVKTPRAISVQRKPAQTAYLIYTSGSTGKPKGVCIGSGELLNLLVSMTHEPGIKADDCLLAVTTVSFDIAILELLGPLMVGGCVHLAGSDVVADGHALIRLIDSVKPSVMQATPSTWSMLLTCGWMGLDELKVLCGGEALSQQLAVNLLDKVGSLWNMYGPTETTVWSTCQQISRGKMPIRVGTPIENTEILILNKNRQPLPPSVSGEVYIGGKGLGQGYWNQSQLTNERFVTLPHLVEQGYSENGQRWFKTGDTGQWSVDGKIEVFGRTDDQIKLRGFRIEPSEIELVLNQYPGIDASCVVLQKEYTKDDRLVAYYLSEVSQDLSLVGLRSHLGLQVPRYMIPQQFVLLENFPLTLNAKIDRKVLSTGAVEGHGLHRMGGQKRHKPATPTELLYADIWKKLLDVSELDLRDTFFDAGGHSLLILQFAAIVRKQTGIEIPLLSVLLNPLGQLSLQFPLPGTQGEVTQLQTDKKNGEAQNNASGDTFWTSLRNLFSLGSRED